MVGGSDDDLRVLIMKRFILPFDSGVVVIKHWKIHNYIRNDRYKETVYQEEKALLELKENGAYTEMATTGIPVGIPSGNQTVNQMETQVRLGKDRLVQDSLGEVKEEAPPPKPVRHKYGSYKNVLLTDEDYGKLMEEFPHDYSDRIERLSEYIASSGKSYKNHLATIRNWSKRDKPQSRPAASRSGNPFLDIVKEGGYE